MNIVVMTFDLSTNWGGRVAMELMRMKVPIVASGKEGLSEILLDQKTAILTRENNAGDITNAIEQFATDKKLRERLIDNAFSFSQRFDVAEHVREIEEIYEEVASASER